MSNVPDVKLCDSFIILICTTKSLCIFIIIYLFNFGKFLKHNLYLAVFVGQLWSNIKSSKPSIVFYFYSNDNIYKTILHIIVSLTLSHSNIKIV